MKEKVLVTGGAGYIGSHTVLALLEAGYDVVVLDNLSNSQDTSLRQVTKICGRESTFIKGDILDEELLDQLFNTYKILAVLHFAGAKAVGESVSDPLKYYENNVAGSINLFKAMARNNVFNLVFSSSATVYGDTTDVPIKETSPLCKPTNPYGSTKLIVESILADLSVADPRWRIAVLRYFNPIGAHESGLIGEHPLGTPNNLLPYLSKVAIGTLPELMIFGQDHPTKDGTGIRDYIHVVDLADGHVKALRMIDSIDGIRHWNLGTGRGHSVLEVISLFEKVTQQKIKYRFTSRRAGDVAECWSDPSKAALELGWTAKRNLEDMLRDTWRWQSQYPNGYVV